MKGFWQTRLGVVGRRALLTGLLVSSALAVAAARAQTGRLVVRVTDSGFAPAEAAVDAGLIHLALENGSGREVVRVRVGREGGETFREVEVRGRGVSVPTELDASAAGVYTLTEPERGWVFRITVRGGPPAPAPPPEDE